MMRKISAWLNLAWHFAKHVLTRLWLRPFRRGRDLQRFRAAVAPEGYLPLLAAERAEFPRTMRCIHCGLCALPCTALQQQPASAWEEAWTFAGGAARSIDRARLVAADLSPCAMDPHAQAVCPMGVPINTMSVMIRRMVQ